MSTVSVSADGRRAVTGSFDSTVRVWDLEAGALLHVLPGDRETVERTAISADGRRAIACSQRTVWVWDLENGRALSTTPDAAHAVYAVALSADGRVAGYGDIRSGITLWDVDGGTPRTLRSHGTGVVGLALSADGSLAASLASHGAVRIWSAETGRCLRTCPGGRRLRFGAVRFGPDERRVLTASSEGQRRWGVPHGYVAPLLPCRPRSHADLVQREARARALVAEAGRALDGERLPDALALLRQAREIPGFERAAPLLHAWRRMGERSARTGVRSVWDAPPLLGHIGYVHDVAVGHDPHQAVTGGTDGTVRLWDLESGRQTAAVEGYGTVAAVSANRDGSQVLFLAVENEQLLSWRPGGAVHVLNHGIMRRFEATPDGRAALVLGTDRRLHLLDGTDGHVIRSFEQSGDDTHTLCLGGDARLAVDRDWQTVHVWDTTDGRCLGTFRPPGANLEAACASAPTAGAGW